MGDLLGGSVVSTSTPRPATAADGDVVYWKIEKEHSRVEVAPLMVSPPSVLVSVVRPRGYPAPPTPPGEPVPVGLGIPLTAVEVEDMIDALRRALAAAQQGAPS